MKLKVLNSYPSSTESYTTSYKFVAKNHDVKCLGVGFGKELCECDRVVAKCFRLGFDNENDVDSNVRKVIKIPFC